MGNDRSGASYRKKIAHMRSRRDRDAHQLIYTLRVVSPAHIMRTALNAALRSSPADHGCFLQGYRLVRMQVDSNDQRVHTRRRVVNMPSQRAALLACAGRSRDGVFPAIGETLREISGCVWRNEMIE